MNIYIINLFLLLIYSLILKPYRSYKNSKIFIIIMFLQLLTIYSLRSYNVGWDSKNYVDVFLYSNEIPLKGIFDHWMEFGYIVLNKAVRYFTVNYVFLWLVLGIIILVPVLKSFLLYSHNVVFSLFLFISFGFYYNSMNQMRESIAVSICIYAFKNVIEKKYISAGIISLIACCFHKSAIIFILFIVSVKFLKKMDLKALIKIGVGITFVLVFFQYILEYLTSFFYTNYFVESTLLKHTKAGELNMFIVFLGVFLLGMYFRKSYVKNFTDKVRVYDISLIAVAFAVGLQLISIKLTMIARFSEYFTIYSCLVIPNALQVLKNKKGKLMVVLLIIILMLIYSYIYLILSENGFGKDRVIPYEFFWNI